jgi:putative SOS response-associated peptidase YedK
MCGGFTITADKKRIMQRYAGGGAEFENGFVPRENARPSEKLPIISMRNAEGIVLGKWGLPMPWDAGKVLINVRKESLLKPSFRDLFERGRCIIPADGFYEWEKVNSKKIPHRYGLNSGEIFSMAGLCEYGPQGISFTILTVPANEMVSAIHDRMPAIVLPEDEKKWLSGEDVSLNPFPSSLMKDEKVSDRINRPTGD